MRKNNADCQELQELIKNGIEYLVLLSDGLEMVMECLRSEHAAEVYAQLEDKEDLKKAGMFQEVIKQTFDTLDFWSNAQPSDILFLIGQSRYYI